MRIMVTGANGFLGRGIVKALIDRGHEVVANDVYECICDSRAIVHVGNVFEMENPYEAFGKPDVLLHLAWRDGFRHDAFSHIEDLPKHFMFVHKMMEKGLKRIAVMGTMHEVGFFEGAIHDDTPTNPLSLYGIAKDALRKMTFLEAGKYDVICQWIRGYYIVGNTGYGSSVFSKIARAAEQGEETFPFTLGKNQWDFLDYDEFCRQVSAIVCQDKIYGVINACSGYPERLADRVERFIKENNYNIRLDYGAFPDRPYDSKAVWGDDKKIKEILDNDIAGET